MTTVVLSPAPYLHFHDNDGRPLSNGTLYTYVAGTTTPLATFTDATGTQPNTNPIVLDFRGEASIWLDVTRIYKFVLCDRNGATIWTQDNVFAGAGQMQISEVIKTIDSIANNSAALQPDPELVVTLNSMGQYDVEIFLVFDAAGAATDSAGIQFSFTTSFGDTRGTIPVLIQGSVNNLLIGNVTTLENLFSFTPISTAIYGNIILIKGSILASSPGILSLSWAQEATAAHNTTLRAGSYLKVTMAESQQTGATASAITRSYSQPGSGIEIIPPLMNNLTIELWGGGGGGGDYYVGTTDFTGGGGGAGEYVKLQMTITGMQGQQINYVVGQGGNFGISGTSGANGLASTVQPGTGSSAAFTLVTAIGGNGGAPATASGNGAPGGATAVSNTAQAALVTDIAGAAGNGQTGAAATSGVNGAAGAGGNGGAMVNPNSPTQNFAQAGRDGLIVFAYTV